MNNLNDEINSMLSGSVAGQIKFEGGGSNVTITPTLETGTKIADFTVGETSGELFAPTPESPVEYTAGDNITIEDGVISATDRKIFLPTPSRCFHAGCRPACL